MKLSGVNTKNKVLIAEEKIPFLNIHQISLPPHHTLQLPQVFERVGERGRGGTQPTENISIKRHWLCAFLFGSSKESAAVRSVRLRSLLPKIITTNGV